MAGSSSSNSSGYSNSRSTPTTVQTPQSEWALQLSQMLGALSQNQYGWAMDQFNKGSVVTDGSINNYMKLAGMGAGLAQNLLGRYTQVFQPIMDKFIQQAGSYNSEDRQHFKMGEAESTAAQSDKAAMDSAQRNLQGFGINPNSGRYQDLLLTSRMQDAATRAGAGTQASVNTAQIGRQMTQQAAQMGQNVPGMTVNALQSAYTGVTGAENAILGLLNTGANLTNTAANFGNAAGNANKLPPVGQVSTGTSQNRSVSGSNTQDPNKDNQKQQQRQQPGNRGSGSGNGDGSGMNGKGMQQNGAKPQVFQNPNRPGQDDQQGDYATAGGLGLGNVNPNDMPNWLNNPTLTDNPLGPGTPGQETSPDNTNWPDPSGGQNFPIGTGQGPGTNPNGVGSIDPTQNGGLGFQPTSATWDNPSGQQDQGGGFGGDQQGGNYANGSNYQAPQPSGDYSASPNSGYSSGSYQPQAQDQGSNYQAPGNYQNGSNYQAQGPSGDYSASPDSGYASGSYQAPSSSGSDYGNYAKGGQVRGMIPNRTSGGPVPRSASPSQGRVTDDIPARLNAKEFVIPRDVSEHYGTKYFHDLIAKSRKLRTGMAGPPAQPKMRPALNQRPTFVSQRMGA